jgi:choline monooxygenase
MSVLNFKFDERLAFASTPPSDWYFKPDFLALEKRHIFARTWQLVGRESDVAEPGQFFTTTIGDEPVIVARAKDRSLRALSNVCRHRAGPVAEGAGSRDTFRCGYHGWSYSLDGRLMGTPEFERVECFSKEETRLPQFQIAVWNGLIFVKLIADTIGLADFLGDIPERLAGRSLSDMRFAARKDWYVDCNWKVYVDNYLEGYHIPIVHPSLNREIDYGLYKTETKRYHSIQHSPVRADRAERIRLDGDQGGEAQYFWLFPNLMLNVYPDNYSTNLIVPLGPERTLTIFEWYFRDPDDPKTREDIEATVAFSDEIQIEDIKICESVQRGLRSMTYDHGRYSVKRENGVHHFHGLLAEYLYETD